MKKIICIIFAVLLLTFALGAAEIPDERQLPLLVDDAGLLDDSEYSELLSLLTEISERRQCEVAIITVNSLGGRTAESYADDFYDYNGYGYGPNDDGVLLLIAMNEREWHITTYGYGITAFTDYGIDRIGDAMVDYLSDGDYYRAFRTFADYCDDYIGCALEGNPVDVGSEKPDILMMLLTSLIIGFIPAIITVSAMKSQLKTVGAKNSAADYTIDGSMRLTQNSDMFLYRNVNRVARPKESSGGGGGSSTHTSSSGRSHGGGGGRF